ncbi:diacylglycerol kinase [Streptomyces sp. RFCAC02]|uniref:diacylglycerol kinase n=1 Tax=Streptomyces sp. RFCAC02 TaxID=2499143 RepID=UPI00101EBC01|nr:diacylglycerol kinase [Streptomyces sp. RFCAC02]
MADDVTFLLNPAAGRGRAAARARAAVEALRAAGTAVRTVVGHDARDALRRAREAVAGGTRAVIAAGGDGMVSLALQATAATSTPLGIVPLGTGNDFARACGLPVRDPAAAGRAVAAAIAADRWRPVDLGRVGEVWFGSVLASGFDARVNDRGNRMRRPRGRLRYDVALVAELAGLRPLPYRMRVDGGPWEEFRATLVAVGNGPAYGGGMRICPDARLDDGLLDITVVGPCTRRTLVGVFPRVYRGTHTAHPAVTVRRAREVALDVPDAHGYADGEPIGPLPVSAVCVPGALRLLVPQP